MITGVDIVLQHFGAILALRGERLLYEWQWQAQLIPGNETSSSERAESSKHNRGGNTLTNTQHIRNSRYPRLDRGATA